MGCVELSVTLVNKKERPTFLTYKAPAWTEVPISRNLRPSHSIALDFHMLEKEYDSLAQVSATRRTALILGTKNQADTLLVRSVTNLPVQLVDLEQTIYERFLECMDNIERAVLDPSLSKKGHMPSSRIFFHVLSPIVGCTERAPSVAAHGIPTSRHCARVCNPWLIRTRRRAAKSSEFCVGVSFRRRTSCSD
jgi:hypothetical protein